MRIKGNYSLVDRVADLEVALPVIIRQIIPEYAARGVSWNGEIVLMGNSAGGNVAACASEIIRPTALILDAPAAYSAPAQTLPWGPGFKVEINREGSWMASLAFGAFKRYLEMGGNALIVEASNDVIVPPAITQTYLKSVPQHYRQVAEQAQMPPGFILDYLVYSGGHEDIHPNEVKRIVEFATSLSGES